MTTPPMPALAEIALDSRPTPLLVDRDDPSDETGAGGDARHDDLDRIVSRAATAACAAHPGRHWFSPLAVNAAFRFFVRRLLASGRKGFSAGDKASAAADPLVGDLLRTSPLQPAELVDACVAMSGLRYGDAFGKREGVMRLAIHSACAFAATWLALATASWWLAPNAFLSPYSRPNDPLILNWLAYALLPFCALFELELFLVFRRRALVVRCLRVAESKLVAFDPIGQSLGRQGWQMAFTLGGIFAWLFLSVLGVAFGLFFCIASLRFVPFDRADLLLACLAASALVAALPALFVGGGHAEEAMLALEDRLVTAARGAKQED
jgi:hypothetical protein